MQARKLQYIRQILISLRTDITILFMDVYNANKIETAIKHLYSRPLDYQASMIHDI